MTITNGYCTLDDLQTAIGISTSDTTDDAALEAAVEAASRKFDAHCGRGRKFWIDGTVVARYYWPCGNIAYVDDIATTTGLLVAVDQGGDGTYETSLTIDTDFIVEPVNADVEYPVRPYTRIRLLSTGQVSTFPQNASGRPCLKVTAKYGWSAVPRAVERACVMEARAIFKAPDTTFGVFAAGLDGQARQIPFLDPTARALLEDFVRWEQVDDGA